MSEKDHLGDLPEAVPLTRVAPGWRLLAVMLAFLSAVLLLAICVLGFAVAEKYFDDASATVVTTVPPAPPVVASLPVSVDPTVEHPYPVVQDLRANQPAVDPKAARNTARDRFLRLGREMWKIPPNQFPSHMIVSPDGQELVYINGDNLVVGPFAGPQIITDSMNYNPQLQVKPIGVPSWSMDGRKLYIADRNGRLRWYDRDNHRFETFTNFEGDSPATVPSDADKLIFIRSQPVAKVETPGVVADNDQTEVVLGDNKTYKVERTLIPLSSTSWSYPAVSPDGKRVALVSDRDAGAAKLRWRIFILDIASGNVKAITPPAAQAGPICWTPDGNALIYTRSQEHLLSDHWESAHGQGNQPTDLFLWDLKTNRETRLSRGGGFSSPSITQEDELFFLVRKVEPSGISLRLRGVPLKDVPEFAQQEPEPVVRDAAAWTALLERVLAESMIAAEAAAANDGEAVTPEVLATLASNFERHYREQFKADPPKDLVGFQRLSQELALLSFPQEVRQRFYLVFGAVRGEYLRRQHGARWQLAKGPLVSAIPMDAATPFGIAVNPFQTRTLARAGDDRLQWPALEDLIQSAEGRLLVLTNDQATAQTALQQLTDPELAQAVELFKQDKGVEAEQLLLNMMRRKPHETNCHLALHVGQLLHARQCKVALSQLMEDQCAQEPPDARKFNLLGVSLLKTKQDEAITAFKKALRCDLHFGPAYLNLAQAYEECGRHKRARECLQRYLNLMPHGALAADARRRLSSLKNDEQGW